jgi:hypothetical protein
MPRTATAPTSLSHTATMSEDQSPEAIVTAAELRAESDTFVAQLDRLIELESQKREMPPSDPRFVSLAVQVEDAAAALLDDARGQTTLGDAAHTVGLEDPIAVISPNLSAIELISAWRDAERKLSALPPGSDEARGLRLMIDAYRRAYQTVFQDLRDRS